MKKEYIELLSEIKDNILKSRYRAASLANKEMLLLYYNVGLRLSIKVKQEKWGSGIIQNISKDLQNELPGLRGYSYRNLKKMQQFAEEYLILPLVTAELDDKTILPLPTAEINKSNKSNRIEQLVTNKLKEKEFIQLIIENFKSVEYFIEDIFLKIGFSHHILLINKCKDIHERLFYFRKTVENQWSITILEHHIKGNLYRQKGKLINNFDKTLTPKLHKYATDTFKGEYLLDFVNIEESDDERVLEKEIVKNIRRFIMSIGNDFAFLGNQYRLVVDNEEFYVDLLFFHRGIQSLVAFELKRGNFKAEYAGKMNLYLSALDEYVKRENENPSIGIILCKKKRDKIVEFAFRDYNKAMGVATYKTTRELPEAYKKYLPELDKLRDLL